MRPSVLHRSDNQRLTCAAHNDIHEYRSDERFPANQPRVGTGFGLAPIVVPPLIALKDYPNRQPRTRGASPKDEPRPLASYQPHHALDARAHAVHIMKDIQSDFIC